MYGNVNDHAATARILEQIRDVCSRNTDVPTLVVGDLNVEPDGPEVS